MSRYHPDTIRYFFTINGPEQKDADFSFREFINSHNGELLGAFGNFVNRTLVFIEKFFNRRIDGEWDQNIKNELAHLYQKVGEKVEKGQNKVALELIFDYIRSCNKYFDTKQPWVTIKNDIDTCRHTLYNCVQIIANLSNLLTPFLPFSTLEIRQFLKIETPSWEIITINNHELNSSKVLFERIDKKQIEEEQQRLINQNK